jgi:hypothetical protein
VGKIRFYGQINISQLFLEERETCFSISIHIVPMVFICHHERFFRVKSTMQFEVAAIVSTDVFSILLVLPTKGMKESPSFTACLHMCS